MSWRTEYLSAIRTRDAQEHAQKEVYDAYAKLADRSTDTKPALVADSSTTGVPASNTAQIQADLVEAQKARGDLSRRLVEVNDELGKLQTKSKDEGRRLAQLTSERALLLTKVKDRDEELRGKTRLINEVHDETLALTLQLNVKEEDNQRLKNENKELVDRWMARMGQEAEAMNTASKFS